VKIVNKIRNLRQLSHDNDHLTWFVMQAQSTYLQFPAAM